MVTIDLTTAPPPPPSFLEGLPRRLTLTLPELRQVAQLAGDAPLPFDVVDPGRPASAGLQGRLGHTGASTDEQAYAAALSSLHDPMETLRRRGLVGEDGVDPRLAGAIGLLATPELALDIDVSASGTQVKAWHRQAGNAVATLATCDGVVFELAWFAVDQWPAELCRAAAIPEDVPISASALPEEIDLPFHLVDSVGEALRSGRSDLVPVLIERHGGSTSGVGGTALTSAEAATATAGIHTEGQGRLRVLAARVADEETRAVGLVSWVLLADGWHSLVPHQLEDESRLVIRRTTPDALAIELAPVLAQVKA